MSTSVQEAASLDIDRRWIGGIQYPTMNAILDVVEHGRATHFAWRDEGTLEGPQSFNFFASSDYHRPLLVDIQTAAAIVRVYENLNEANRTKMEKSITLSRPMFLKIAAFCMEKTRRKA